MRREDAERAKYTLSVVVTAVFTTTFLPSRSKFLGVLAVPANHLRPAAPEIEHDPRDKLPFKSDSQFVSEFRAMIRPADPNDGRQSGAVSVRD